MLLLPQELLGLLLLLQGLQCQALPQQALPLQALLQPPLLLGPPPGVTVSA